MKTAGKLFPITCFLILVPLLILFGCAKVGTVPGGPVDRTPPEIITSTPPTGAVDVPVDSSVIIEFSEPIDPKSVEKALFITPLQESKPKVKVRKTSIVISFPDNLEENRTYVITLGTDLRDAHRVVLAQAVTVAFSTGPTIDTGSIAGTVYEKTEGKAAVSLALFADDPAKSGLPIDSLTPEYFTQSGEGGAYSFNYLPPGRYYPIAFSDRNKNRLIEPEREMIGLPYADAVLDSVVPNLSGIDIRLHKQEADRLGLRSVSINPDRLLKIRFDRKLNRKEAEKLLATAAITGDSAESAPINDYTNMTAWPSSDFLIPAENLVTGGDYFMTFDLTSLQAGLADSLKQLSYKFTVVEITDNKPPKLMETYPSDGSTNVAVDSALKFRFSEPVDPTAIADAVRITDSSGEWRSVTIAPETGFSYRGVTEDRLQNGHWYQVELDRTRIIDRAGNRLGDSTTIVSFTTIGSDTLGQLSGRISFTDANDAAFPVIITFNPAPQGVQKEITVAPGQQEFISELLPGYYTASAHLDRNRNGRFDYGSIIPYQLAEPFAAPADTIRVRTRFESTGADLIF